MPVRSRPETRTWPSLQKLPSMSARFFSLPGEWKMRGGWNKYLVREALKGVIAERVRTRTDKMGFPTPSKDWWAGAWYAPMMDLLGSRTLRESGVCDADTVRGSLQRHAQGQVDFAAELFRLAEFVTWLEVKGTVATSDPHATASDAQALAAKDAALARSHSGGDLHA